MLEQILKLYVMAMLADVRSPIPHLVGPPGCGKSTVVEQLAELLGKKLHILNVSRLSPLEVEGVQMPHGTGEDMLLRMLPATYWKSLQDGDILLLDEFLRGFPEVYNALLDILTARRVGAFVLPKVFIIAASNSVVAYDKALEDRLIHVFVPDPRKGKVAKRNLAQILVDQLGLLPEMRDSIEMQTLLDTEVLPMFEILDVFKGKGNTGIQLKGTSIRKLIGQAQLREVQSTQLKELLDMNNHRACAASKWQYVVLSNGKNPDANYVKNIKKIPDAKLTPVQLLNRNLNNQLIELEVARSEKEGPVEDHDAFDEEPPF